MRHLLIAGVMVLTSTATSSAQTQLVLPSTSPVNLVFLTATVDEALTVMARAGGITIEFDATVTGEMRAAQLASQPLKFNNVTFEQVITMLTSSNGLVYTVTGPKAIRISKKP